MTQLLLSIGSNTDRRASIQASKKQLAAHFEAVRFSHTYTCAAVGFDGPDFYNLAAVMESADSAEEVRRTLRQIEDEIGRTREGPRFGNRVIDIDLVAYGEHALKTEHMNLPRVELYEQAFVLLPLVELVPQWRDPVGGLTLFDLWTDMSRRGHDLERVALD